jgi:ligand-binding sensor domain-containing protein/signal transduction histidine kinase/DNA-binding response OmpR family regulator
MFVYAQSEMSVIRHITKSEGLSSSAITSIVQDKQGFLWIGTHSGLNRFDGKTIQVYRNIPGDSTSLCDNSITCLFVNQLGELWVGTENNGVSIYSAETNNFRSFRNTLHPNTLSFDHVTSIKEDANRNMWIATLMGLNRYQREQNNFKRYLSFVSVAPAPYLLDSLKKNGCPNEFLRRLKLSSGPVSNDVFFANIPFSEASQPWINMISRFSNVERKATAIKSLETDYERLWLGLDNGGLARLDLTTKLRYQRIAALSNMKIEVILKDGGKLWIGTLDEGVHSFTIRDSTVKHFPETTDGKFTRSIVRDLQGKLWAGDVEGLSVLNENLNKFERISSDNVNNGGLAAADVTTIFEDRFENFWVASNYGGLTLLTRETNFKRQVIYEDNSNTRCRAISAVLQDHDHNLWIGYFSSGIDVFTAKGILKKSFRPGVKTGLGKGSVHTIFQDSKGKIWVGTFEGGLQQYNKDVSRFTKLDFSENKKSFNDVRSICEDKHGNIWVAVHGDGIKKYNPTTRAFSHYRTNYKILESSLASDWTFTVYCDSKNRIWVGGIMGASVMAEENIFHTFNKENRKLSHNVVHVINEDKKGRVWIGTQEGLNCLKENASPDIYSERNGLPSGDIRGILEDTDGFLWVSTSNGVARLEPEKHLTKVYVTNKDFHPNEFFPAACTRGASGRFFFGGEKGIDSFDPKGILECSHPYPVVLTDFKIFNESVGISQEKGAILRAAISHTNEVTLPYDKNVFSIDFTELNFVVPEQSSYAYRMEGFEEKWNYVKDKKEATYTNLDPGTYIFHVKGANHDGVWSDTPTSLKINILPPWWLRTESKIGYVLVALVVCFFIRRAVIARLRLRHSIELHEMKLKFFANISHELRTPLALLLGPITDLSLSTKLWKKDQSELIAMMNTNGQQMISLINQLTNIHKIDAGVMHLRVSEGDLSSIVRNVFDRFQYQARKLAIDYQLSIAESEIVGFYDSEKVEQMLMNLLGNAFKYLDGGLSIAVQLCVVESFSVEVPASLRRKSTVSGRFASVSINDAGRGIALEVQNKIFERFYREEESNTGTGIGLALARDLARIHLGDITVSSRPGKGSIFTIWIPIDGAAYKPAHISGRKQISIEQVSISQGAVIDGVAEHFQGEGLPQLLIIDDHEDIRSFIYYCFRGLFNVIQAKNGEEGLAKTLELIPDFVICDVMLPGINGFDVCAKIKREPRTSHIPVILLTAKTSEASLLKGIEECSADDYITKPFNTDVLKAKVKNIHAYRNKLKLTLQMELQNACEPSRSADNVFLNKVIEAIENNLDNSAFDLALLTKAIGMSQTNLYKKLQAVVGLSASQLIRTIRLKKSQQLLKTGLSIVEVADRVGFSDPKYFSKVFKHQFGMLPHEFTKATNETELAETLKKQLE